MTNLGMGGSNPYLQGQAQGLATVFNNNLTRNVLPAVRGGAVASGQYGSSRQGIAEGLAMSDANQQLSTALSNLYSNQYNTDQNNATQRYTSDNALKGTMYSSDNSLTGTKYSADSSSDASRYSTDAGMRNTDVNAATQRYSSDNSLAGTRYASDSSAGASRYATDAGMRNTDVNANVTRRGQDQNYDLGLRNNSLGYLNSDRNYDLGLRGNQLANDQLDFNIDRDTYNRGVTNLGLGVGLINQGIDWQRQANNVGTTVQNAPMNYWQQFLNGSTQAGGMGGSSSQTMDGNPWLGALGGLQLGSAFARSLGG